MSSYLYVDIWLFRMWNSKRLQYKFLPEIQTPKFFIFKKKLVLRTDLCVIYEPTLANRITDIGLSTMPDLKKMYAWMFMDLVRSNSNTWYAEYNKSTATTVRDTSERANLVANF